MGIGLRTLLIATVFGALYNWWVATERVAMGKKKSQKKNRPLPAGYDGVTPTGKKVSQDELVERMKRDPLVSKAVEELQGQIAEIRNARPIAPDPPLRHDYDNEVWKEHETDPHQTWLKVFCKRCAFVVYVKAGELREKVLALSAYCAMPFATASEAEILVRRWEASVAEAYEAIEPAERARIAKAIQGGSVVADDRANRLSEDMNQMALDLDSSPSEWP